jgi:hypothetical protein
MVENESTTEPAEITFLRHSIAARPGLSLETRDNGAAKPRARRCTKRRVSTAQSIGNGEVPIEELLTDPIAELLRRRDRLALQDVRDCIEDARRKLRRCQRQVEDSFRRSPARR